MGEADAPEAPRRPSRYDVVTGFIVGRDIGTAPLPTTADGNARGALERAVAGALTREPCLVSFSGGRDSSAILAVATHVAHREGLPLPVPVTLRFPGAESDESHWQEDVIRHLGLKDWDLVQLEEIDLVGPVAAGVLRRHGVLWPANAHFHAPMLARAAGGSLLTGIDGDVLFGGWKWASPPDASAWSGLSLLAEYSGHLAFGVLPRKPRQLVGRRAFARAPWIQPVGWTEIVAHLASVWELEPRRWDARVAWWHRRRYLASGRWSLSVLAADHDVEVVHPLLDPSFLAALARAGGRRGFGGRSHVMSALFGDLLPHAVLRREDKATFDSATWGEHSRRFIREWDGAGVDEALVHVPSLRSEWNRPVPHFQTAMLLQTAWLHVNGAAADG